MSIKIFSKTVGTLFSAFALSKSPQTQHVVESHPSSICFSSHVFSSRAALFSKTICTQTTGLGCPRSLARPRRPAQHIWKWFEAPPHSASTTPAFPAASPRGGRNPSCSKVNASKSLYEWGQEYSLGNVILALGSLALWVFQWDLRSSCSSVKGSSPRPTTT